MSRKKKRLKRFILAAVTEAALVCCMLSVLTMRVFPLGSVTVFALSTAWLMLFFLANE